MNKQPGHHLRYEEEYALNGWLLANKERLESLTKEDQLIAANKELSFPVSIYQLSRRRVKLGIQCAVHRTINPKKPRKNGNGQVRKIDADTVLNDILRSLDNMGEAVAILVKYQAVIFDQLGVEYGEDLSKLANRIKAHQLLLALPDTSNQS